MTNLLPYDNTLMSYQPDHAMAIRKSVVGDFSLVYKSGEKMTVLVNPLSMSEDRAIPAENYIKA